MNSVSEGTKFRKGFAKFSLFLVVGGSINFAGQILPALLSINSAATGAYLTYACIAVSLLPTPIIIMAFLKPVREEAKKIVTCGQFSLCKRHEISNPLTMRLVAENQTPGTGTF